MSNEPSPTDDRRDDPPTVRKKAPGWPGEESRWTSGSKVAGGTARRDTSRVWFTMVGGALTEVYYPRIDSPCIRDLYLIVTGPNGFFSDERTDVDFRVEWMAEGVPGFVVANTCRRGRYRIEKTILTDDRHEVVFQETRFVPLQGSPSDYRVHVHLCPHVGGKGGDNTGWVGEFKGETVLYGQRGDLAVALACSRPFRAASAGFVGKSDGRQDLETHGRLTRTYERAEEGHVALVAEIDLTGGADFLLSLGFGLGPGEASHHARAGLQADLAEVKRTYVRNWREWQDSLLPLDGASAGSGRDLYRQSTAILLSHTNKAIKGAVASLAIPWGNHRNDEDTAHGAYHLVWSRDLVQHGGALLAIGAHVEARDLLRYLRATQEADGHWPQNMWVSGEAYWDGVQLDQAAQPIILADLALHEGAIEPDDRRRFWPMIRLAAGYIVRKGASTEQDRWEEQRGYNPYTIATAIAALAAAADWADEAGEAPLADYLRETAASWNALVEGWLYVRDTAVTRRLGIEGYYARIIPPESVDPPAPGQDCVRIIGDPPEVDGVLSTEIVSVDALALVRLGLRAADDPRILDTIKAIDDILKLDTPRGPIWHRYNGDKFGEGEDGSPYANGKGVGRAWPLLVGERAHYELAAGDRQRAETLMGVMAAFASETGTISEQVWDAPDIPERGLHFGRPTGSVMPLLWAHSEYLKLRRSLRDGAVFDRPPQADRQSPGGREGKPFAIWRVDHPCHAIQAGTRLRVEATEGVDVRWQIGPGESHDLTDERSFLGVRVADLPTAGLSKGTVIGLQVERTSPEGKPVREEHSVTIL